MRVCLTGGAGFIGSHILAELLAERHEVLVIDNFANSSPESLRRVRKITDASFDILEEDICNSRPVAAALKTFRPDCVIHCAGLKAVGESQEKPLLYHRVNVGGAMSLLEAMDAAYCSQIIFSSSATVYGTPEYLPYDEVHPVAPANVYGRTKVAVENMIADWAEAGPSRAAVNLRYFNPVGAHPSGEIGEDPMGIPNNLVPFIADVACGIRPSLSVFGDDYKTRDGTGVRDYIHIVDLAAGHLAAMRYVSRNPGVEVFNLGTGDGSSVLEVVFAFASASGRDIPYEMKPRREGDIDEFYADSAKAERMLGWRAELTLADMCGDVWRWRSKNPDGFGD